MKQKKTKVMEPFMHVIIRGIHLKAALERKKYTPFYRENEGVF
jgi:hypothetical protein